MKKITSLILVLLILAIPLVSCKKGGEDSTSGSATNTATTTSNSAEVLPNDNDDLPDDLNFGGKTYTIFSIAQTWAGGEFSQENEDNGNVVQQAVHLRNINIEDRLHCKLANTESLGNTNTDEMLTTIQNLVMGGMADYQLLVTAGYRMAPLASSGLLTDMRSLKYINLNKDYYSQGYNSILTVGDAQYLATGTFTLGYYRYLMVNLFNKKTFRDHMIEEPYNLVREQKWTFEAMNNITKELYEDVNGDGVRDKNDKYGYVIMTGNDSSFTDAFMSACDLRVMSKDDDNYYKVDINSERYSDAVDTVLKLLFGEGTLSGSDLAATDVYSKFADSSAAMITTRLYGVEDAEVIKLGNSDGYGILPIPKMDENQADYISYVQDQCFMFGIPSILSGNTLTEVSQLFEAFASESYKTVKPAYYEKALTTRYAHDMDSVEMLDLIGKKVYVDPVNAYLLNGFVNTATFRNIYATGINTISSQLASAVGEGKLRILVDELNEQYKSLVS